MSEYKGIWAWANNPAGKLSTFPSYAENGIATKIVVNFKEPLANDSITREQFEKIVELLDSAKLAFERRVL